MVSWDKVRGNEVEDEAEALDGGDGMDGDSGHGGSADESAIERL